MAKKTKTEVDYSKGMPKSHCSLCVHYLGKGVCELVAGKINPAYWCKLFKKKRSA